MGYFKDWWKSLFNGSGETDELGFPVMKREDMLPMPKVKYCKTERNVSEPVFTLVSLFKDNPKRFKFSYDLIEYVHEFTYGDLSDCKIRIQDSDTGEDFVFIVGLKYRAISDHAGRLFQKFAKHKLYPIMGFEFNEYPNWLTEDELVYICSAITPYFQKRVSRYRELVNYRQERRQESHKRKTELDKKKERQRLIKIYQGE